MKDYSFSYSVESYFSEFQNLESFSLQTYNKKISIDIILQALPECRNLKYVSISKCEFTEKDFKNIFLLPNLLSLDLSHTNVTDNQL